MSLLKRKRHKRFKKVKKKEISESIATRHNSQINIKDEDSKANGGGLFTLSFHEKSQTLNQHILLSEDLFMPFKAGSIIKIETITSPTHNSDPIDPICFELKPEYLSKLLDNRGDKKISFSLAFAEKLKMNIRKPSSSFEDLEWHVCGQKEISELELDHVEMSFKSQYLSLRDINEINHGLEGVFIMIGDKMVVNGFDVEVMGLRDGLSQEVPFGIVKVGRTKINFFSLSSKVVLTVQICRESFLYTSDGQLVLMSYLDFLRLYFSNLNKHNTNHSIIIIFHTRVFFKEYKNRNLLYLDALRHQVPYSLTCSFLQDKNGEAFRDFYHKLQISCKAFSLTNGETFQKIKEHMINFLVNLPLKKNPYEKIKHFSEFLSQKNPIKLTLKNEDFFQGELCTSLTSNVLEAVSLFLEGNDHSQKHKNLKMTGTIVLSLVAKNERFFVEEYFFRYLKLKLFLNDAKLNFVSFYDEVETITPTFLAVDDELVIAFLRRKELEKRSPGRFSEYKMNVKSARKTKKRLNSSSNYKHLMGDLQGVSAPPESSKLRKRALQTPGRTPKHINHDLMREISINTKLKSIMQKSGSIDDLIQKHPYKQLHKVTSNQYMVKFRTVFNQANPTLNGCIMRFKHAKEKISFGRYFSKHMLKELIEIHNLKISETEYYEFLKSYLGYVDIKSKEDNLVDMTNEEIYKKFPEYREELETIFGSCGHSSHRILIHDNEFERKDLDLFLRFFEDKDLFKCFKFQSLDDYKQVCSKKRDELNYLSEIQVGREKGRKPCGPAIKISQAFFGGLMDKLTSGYAAEKGGFGDMDGEMLKRNKLIMSGEIKRKVHSYVRKGAPKSSSISNFKNMKKLGNYELQKEKLRRGMNQTKRRDLYANGLAKSGSGAAGSENLSYKKKMGFSENRKRLSSSMVNPTPITIQRSRRITIEKGTPQSGTLQSIPEKKLIFSKSRLEMIGLIARTSSMEPFTPTGVNNRRMAALNHENRWFNFSDFWTNKNRKFWRDISLGRIPPLYCAHKPPKNQLRYSQNMHSMVYQGDNLSSLLQTLTNLRLIHGFQMLPAVSKNKNLQKLYFVKGHLNHEIKASLASIQVQKRHRNKNVSIFGNRYEVSKNDINFFFYNYSIWSNCVERFLSGNKFFFNRDMVYWEILDECIINEDEGIKKKFGDQSFKKGLFCMNIVVYRPLGSPGGEKSDSSRPRKNSSFASFVGGNKKKRKSTSARSINIQSNKMVKKKRIMNRGASFNSDLGVTEGLFPGAGSSFSGQGNSLGVPQTKLGASLGTGSLGANSGNLAGSAQLNASKAVLKGEPKQLTLTGHSNQPVLQEKPKTPKNNIFATFIKNLNERIEMITKQPSRLKLGSSFQPINSADLRRHLGESHAKENHDNYLCVEVYEGNYKESIILEISWLTQDSFVIYSFQRIILQAAEKTGLKAVKLDCSIPRFFEVVILEPCIIIKGLGKEKMEAKIKELKKRGFFEINFGASRQRIRGEWNTREDTKKSVDSFQKGQFNYSYLFHPRAYMWVIVRESSLELVEFISAESVINDISLERHRLSILDVFGGEDDSAEGVAPVKSREASIDDEILEMEKEGSGEKFQ